MKKICICTGLWMFMHLVHGQSISNQVVASSGFSASSGGSSIAFTSGELMVKTEVSAGVILTQGFHQPYLGSSSVTNEENVALIFYPNPTIDRVHIKMITGDPATLDVEVYDIFARKVQVSSSREDQSLIVHLESLAAATYQVHIFNRHTGQILKTFKIQKISNQ
jgi:hypothetical protein